MKPKRVNTASLRIIGGQWRGRKLPIAVSPGLRPSGDRVRETLFNWLQSHELVNCLDLFAGTGALGFEALSRGATEAHLVEQDASLAKQLRQNSSMLQCTSAKIHHANAVTWLQAAAQSYRAHFDLVFVDPPFASNLWVAVLRALNQSGVLTKNALIYIEHPRSVPLGFSGLSTVKEKSGGGVRYGLYQINDELGVNCR